MRKHQEYAALLQLCLQNEIQCMTKKERKEMTEGKHFFFIKLLLFHLLQKDSGFIYNIHMEL